MISTPSQSLQSHHVVIKCVPSSPFVQGRQQLTRFACACWGRRRCHVHVEWTSHWEYAAHCKCSPTFCIQRLLWLYYKAPGSFSLCPLSVSLPLCSSLNSSTVACMDAAQSTLCWTAAYPLRGSLAFLAGEHKCWPQDRTLSPLLWVTALLEMWT